MALSPAAMHSQMRGRKSAYKRYRLTHAICEACFYVDARERHHRNGNARDNRPENVLLLCIPCHKREHSGERWHQDRAPRTLTPAQAHEAREQAAAEEAALAYARKVLMGAS